MLPESMINCLCYGALQIEVMAFLSLAPENCSLEFLDTSLYQKAYIVEQKRFNPGPNPPALKSVMGMRDSLGLLMREGNTPIGYVVGADLSSYNKRKGSKQGPDDTKTFFIYDLAAVKSDPQTELNVCDTLLYKLENLLCVSYKVGGRGADRDYTDLMLVLPESPKNHGLSQMLIDAGYEKNEKRQNGSKFFEFITKLDVDKQKE